MPFRLSAAEVRREALLRDANFAKPFRVISTIDFPWAGETTIGSWRFSELRSWLDLFLQFCQKVERVKRFQVIEVGFVDSAHHIGVERRKDGELKFIRVVR